MQWPKEKGKKDGCFGRVKGNIIIHRSFIDYSVVSYISCQNLDLFQRLKVLLRSLLHVQHFE